MMFRISMSGETAISVAEGTGTSGRVRIDRYNPEIFTMFPDWGEKSLKEKVRITDSFEPAKSNTYHNKSVKGQHMLLVDYLDRGQNPGESAAYLGLGSDNSQPVEYDNKSLNAEVYRTDVTNTGDYETQLEATTFVGATEANDADAIREVGLFTSDVPGEGHMINHSLVEPEPKSSQVALTITVTLNFEAL